MNRKDVIRRVAEIEKVMGDNEAAHSKADSLWHDVLVAIASGCAENPSEVAREALRVLDFDFKWWCG